MLVSLLSYDHASIRWKKLKLAALHFVDSAEKVAGPVKAKLADRNEKRREVKEEPVVERMVRDLSMNMVIWYEGRGRG